MEAHMTVASKLIGHLADLAAGRRTERVQIGLVYSAAQLDRGTVGVSYTFPNTRSCRGRSAFQRPKPFAGQEVGDLVKALGGADLLQSSVAMAAANALLASLSLPSAARAADVLEAVEIRPGERVCMVGCFLPLLQGLKERQVSVTVVDEVPKPGSRPPEEAARLLPESQIAIITATSIINGTIDGLLEMAVSCREVVILGPSTPLLPEAFAGTPVTCLSGIRVAQPDAVIQSIAEGGGFCEFKRFVQKWNIPLRQS
jgi:uncharacterized protein (DUF4213/DUF364 family)